MSNPILLSTLKNIKKNEYSKSSLSTGEYSYNSGVLPAQNGHKIPQNSITNLISRIFLKITEGIKS